MPRKVGAIMTQLKDKAAAAERNVQRLLWRIRELEKQIRDMEAEIHRLKMQLSQKEGK